MMFRLFVMPPAAAFLMTLAEDVGEAVDVLDGVLAGPLQLGDVLLLELLAHLVVLLGLGIGPAQPQELQRLPQCPGTGR